MEKSPAGRLRFEEKKPASRLLYDARDAPLEAVRGAVHRKIRESDEDNAGTEAADTLAEAAEDGYRTTERTRRSRSERTGGRTPDGNSAGSGPKRQQRQTIRKDYAAKAGNTTVSSEKTAQDSAEKIRRAGQFIRKNKKALLILGGFAALVVVVMTVVSSCSVLLEGMSSVAASLAYPTEESDLLSAEETYRELEDELRGYLDSYESTHDYDGYVFDLDEIGHDPYVLLSAVSAMSGGEWTADEIGGILQTLFDRQYILTETVTVETAYRTETTTGIQYVYDRQTGSYFTVPYSYETPVPYEYHVCTVRLENTDLSCVPVSVMGQSQLSAYAAYMSALGGQPELFPDSEYVDKYYNREYEKYEIPPEALEDERFALMIAEAEKYLGYPYVWGGSSPSTSFDCSGFVSWVCNHSGAGWNFGRIDAASLLRLCTEIPLSDARPGDLVFFQGTFDREGVSHVGLYVGNGMMIHAGDPIHYESIETNYWRQHFLTCGRLPEP